MYGQANRDHVALYFRISPNKSLPRNIRNHRRLLAARLLGKKKKIKNKTK
jgi:hypothetical protein